MYDAIIDVNVHIKTGVITGWQKLMFIVCL